MNTPRLETDRLILRKFTEDDLEALYYMHSDEEVNRFLPWFPLRNMEDARAFYEERFMSRYREERAYNYAVCLKENDYLVLDIVDYERDLKIENVEKAAKLLNVPLFERVVMPYASTDKDKPSVTKYEVPVGYIHCKRVQQFLRKKNATSTDISMRSAISGQVMGKDKNARDSDLENYALVTLGAEECLREFMGPRADDPVMKNEMYTQIAKNGYVSLNDLTSDVKNKTTLNTIDVFFTGMGIKTDLVTDGLLVKKTIK